MKILGIDTSTAIASVALVEDGALALEEICPDFSLQGVGASRPERANHAETVLPLVDSLLRKACLTLTDVNALSVAIGPGSFTGLRIGISTVMGLTFGWDMPVVGIPTLPAIAARAAAWNGVICPFLDARKGEVYTALFRNDKNGSLRRLVEDAVSLPEKALRTILSYPREACLLVGSGTQVYRELIESVLSGVDHKVQREMFPSTAFGVARLAEGKVRKREFDSPGLLSPLYLRPSEAEVKKAQGGQKV